MAAADSVQLASPPLRLRPPPPPFYPRELSRPRESRDPSPREWARECRTAPGKPAGRPAGPSARESDGARPARPSEDVRVGGGIGGLTARCLRLVPARRCLSCLYTWNLSPPTLLPRQAAWGYPVGGKAGSSPSRGGLKEWGQSEPTVMVCLQGKQSNRVRRRRAGGTRAREACGSSKHGLRPRGVRAAKGRKAMGRTGGRGGLRPTAGRAGGSGACGRRPRRGAAAAEHKGGGGSRGAHGRPWGVRAAVRRAGGSCERARRRL